MHGFHNAPPVVLGMSGMSFEVEPPSRWMKVGLRAWATKANVPRAVLYLKGLLSGIVHRQTNEIPMTRLMVGDGPRRLMPASHEGLADAAKGVVFGHHFPDVDPSGDGLTWMTEFFYSPIIDRDVRRSRRPARRGDRGSDRLRSQSRLCATKLPHLLPPRGE